MFAEPPVSATHGTGIAAVRREQGPFAQLNLQDSVCVHASLLGGHKMGVFYS